MTAKRKELIAEIETVASRDAELIRGVDNTHLPLKKSSWTIGTAVAHLVLSQRLSKKILQGEKNPYPNADPEAVSETNKKLLASFSERNGKMLATHLVMDTDSFLKEANQYDDDHVMAIHFGRLDLLTGLGHNLFHLLLHGSQIADTLHKPLPVEAKHIAMIMPFIKKAMIVTYDKKAAANFSAVFVLHIKSMSPFAIICEGEIVHITDEIPQHVDCHISLDPISYFQLLAGIASQWKLLFSGKIAVWGRKPWLAMRLPKLFKNP